MIEEVLGDCRFRAKVDIKGTLHILDKQENEPFETVVHSVDDLIPYLLQSFNLEGNPSIVIYESNLSVYLYDNSKRLFKKISSQSNLVDSCYYRLMQRFYSKFKSLSS